jgi:hypothetical protein
MDSLHQALNEAVGALPELFLERRIAQKLKGLGIAAPKSLPSEISKYLLARISHESPNQRPHPDA